MKPFDGPYRGATILVVIGLVLMLPMLYYIVITQQFKTSISLQAGATFELEFFTWWGEPTEVSINFPAPWIGKMREKVGAHEVPFAIEGAITLGTSGPAVQDFRYGIRKPGYVTNVEPITRFQTERFRTYVVRGKILMGDPVLNLSRAYIEASTSQHAPTRGSIFAWLLSLGGAVLLLFGVLRAAYILLAVRFVGTR